MINNYELEITNYDGDRRGIDGESAGESREGECLVLINWIWML
jgi:hypothetical protein